MSYEEYLARLRTRKGLKVLVQCNSACRRLRPLSELYFCVTCKRFVCDLCSTEEMRSNYTPVDIVTAQFSVLATDKNRYSKSAECPNCFTYLSLLSDAASTSYFYHCEFCRWNSTMMDLVAPNPQALFTALQERETKDHPDAAFAQLAQQIKVQVEELKSAENGVPSTPARRKFGPFSGTSAHHQHRSAHREPLSAEVLAKLETNLQRKVNATSVTNVQQTLNDALPTPDFISGDGFELSQVTDLEQRIARPGVQPLLSSSVVPNRAHYLVTTAHRCRECDKYLVKPKNPKTVSFDKLDLAMDFVPRVTVGDVGALRRGAVSNISLYFNNPRRTDVAVTLTEHKASKDERFRDTALVAYPPHAVTMEAYDEISAQDATMRDDRRKDVHKDDPQFVSLRHLSKVGLILRVTPVEDQDIKFACDVHLKAKDKDVAEFDTFTYTIYIHLGLYR